MNKKTIMDLIHNGALLLALGVLYDVFLFYAERNRCLIKFITGCVIGCIGVVVMMNPLVLKPGLIFDTRSVIISVGALFFGTVPAVISVLITGCLRACQGGSGMIMGIGVIFSSAIIGLIFRYYMQQGFSKITLKNLYLHGMAVHVVMICWTFVLPADVRYNVQQTLTIPVLVIYPIISVLLGKLLSLHAKRLENESKISESKQFYETLFEHNHSVMLIIDPETGKIFDANTAASKFYGWERETLRKMKISDISTASKDEIFEKMKEVENSEYGQFYFKHRCADGTVCNVEVNSGPVVLNGKKYLYSIIFNITQRIIAEKELQRSEFKLRRAERIAQVGYWEFDFNSNTVTASEGAQHIYGYSRHIWDISEVKKIPLPKYRELLDISMKNLREGIAAYDVEFEIRRPENGTISWIHSVAEYDRENQIVFGVIHDITDRKSSENTIAAEKERLLVTLRSIGDGVITTDTAGKIVLMNTVAEQLTGWNFKEAVGCLLAEVFQIEHEFTKKPCANPVERVLTTGEIVELENHTILISKTGQRFMIADSGAPIKDNHGNIIGVVLVFRDVTEKYRLIDNMQRTDKLNALGTLAGGIAHDFNNLLSGVFGYIELARSECEGNSKASEYLEKTLKVFKPARELTQQLLTFARGGEPVRKPDDLKEVIQINADFALSGSSVCCEFDIPDDLWWAEFDSNQIGRVIHNLILNAEQAMPEGGTIKVKAENKKVHFSQYPGLKQGDYIQISIKDSGIGILPEMLSKIFDPFFTTKQKGSGLGLATCYSVITRHNGFIEAYSEPGKGTEFMILLPSCEKPDLPVHAGNTELIHGTGRILIMDDEEYVREILKQMLIKLGYTVSGSASCGEEAIELFKKDKYDAVILDLTVPGRMGGDTTAQKIREMDAAIPVFASSGYSEGEVMSKLKEYGFTDCLSKPYTLKELAEFLHRYLGH